MHQSTFVINGVPKTLVVQPDMTLMDVVRKQLLLTGTKDGCEDGHCGACAVLVNGKYTLACITKMSRVPDGAEILTVEGIGTPQHRPDTRQQFRWLEGLGQVVVRADIEAGDPVGRLAFGRQDDDRQVHGCPNALRDLESIHSRHHHVQDHQIGQLLLNQPQPVNAVVGGEDLIAILRQEKGCHLQAGRIVVNYQYTHETRIAQCVVCIA